MVGAILLAKNLRSLLLAGKDGAGREVLPDITGPHYSIEDPRESADFRFLNINAAE
jgi:hypothetical protein